MRRISVVTVAALCLLGAGCGDGMLRTRGRVLQGGQPLIAKDGETLEVMFVPIPPDGKPPTDFYYAEVDQATGTFRPAGKNGKGMPPGKYRVAVELMKKKKDQFGGKFDAEKSPFVFDVDAKTPEIVIDLDHPPK
ncbi:MAG TPA: hypothetical protein VKE74_22100 [Gemmataceae bacterium]|nr:hypothetical protein [Gemmataceae bacterium]